MNRFQLVDNVDFHLLRDLEEDVYHNEEMEANGASDVTPFERKMMELQAANTYQKVMGNDGEFNWFYFE